MALPMVYGGPGRYVQGPGELSRQGRYLSWLGCAAYVLFDQGTEDRLCRQIVDGFLDEDLSEPFFKIYNGPCTEDAVAFGLVVQLRLERAPELDQVLEFCQRVGLPTTLEELGLGEISDADLLSVADATFKNERNMANEQAKVTKQKLVQLMCEA